MSVSDFMTKKVVTVTPSTPVFDAIDLMKANGIHRLPVLEGDHLVGLITEGVIQAALPSKATTLSVYELNYLINKTKVEDIMIKDVLTIQPNALLEDAIAKMRANSIAVLPVMDEGNLVGIITNNDIFDAFLKITGYHEGGTRISVNIAKDRSGVIADLAKILADHEMSISTIVVNRKVDGTIVEFQVVSKQVAEIRQLFEQAGYQVVDAVLTNI
ncbi:CBS and ACT domain-containing protein [Enterococcus camelliae]|uniref:CBS and ACT domain-containing protein n=1 Tax=Enterococcus camelliae TaxID=453959 RepID=A0ABW5TKF1_9ENTE